jgi:integrase
LRSYFAKYDIDIVSAKFKHKVTLPQKIKEKEQPIDASDIRKILLSCNNRRLKAYLLFLMSSGLRAKTEACSIRNKDIEWISPTKIHIRGEYTKTKTSRDSYISDEATKFLKEFIEFRGETAPEQLLFTSYQNRIPKTVKDTKRVANNLYVRLNIDFMNLLKLVGMDARKENGLVNKKRHCITLHSFGIRI